MMKTTKLLFSLMLLLLLHLSCSRDERRPDAPVVSPPNQARITITLEVNNDSPVHSRTAEMPEGETVATDTIKGVAASYSVGDFGIDPAPAVATDSLSTRSTLAPTVNESAINDLWAIQFDENSKLVGKPVYQDGLRGKPDVTLMLTQTPEGKRHTVYFVTNTARADLFTENNVPTLERYRALIHTYANEAGVVAGNVLLATGKYTGTLTDKQTLSQPILLIRSVAKLTFTYGTSNFGDGTIRVIGVQLKNVAHGTAYLEPTAVPYPAIGNHADYAPESAPNEVAGSYTWYLPENVRGVNPTITWEGNKSKKNAPAGQGDYATLIEVRTEVAGHDGATRNIRYLFFIGQDITDYSVKRNRHYLLDIDFRGIDESDQRVMSGNSTPWLAPTVGITDVMGTSATVRATILSDGGSAITNRGFYVTEDRNEIGTARTYLGAGLYAVEGMPSAFTRAAFTPEVVEQILTGFKHNTTYYIRPFAANMYGTTVGEQATLTTTGTPTIVTVQVSEVKLNTAKVEYQITDNGTGTITEKGVAYSMQKDFVPKNARHVSSSSLTELTLGTGSVNSNNPPLTMNTTYYVRGYAGNNAGRGYGKQLMLTTIKSLPFKPVTVSVVQDMYVQATVGVTSSPIPTQMGVMWSTTDFTDPTTGILVEGTQSGSNYVLKLGNSYPATWYLFPYGQVAVGEEHLYGAKYSSNMVATSPTPEISNFNVESHLNRATIVVGAQTQGQGTEGIIRQRGICYSTTSSFDPLDPVRSVPDNSGSENIPNSYQITVDRLALNQYFVRSYVINSVDHRYYSRQSSFIIEPKLVSGVSWGKGEAISPNVPSTYTLEFKTNTDWSFSATNATPTQSSGPSTKWGTKSITLNVDRNEGDPRDISVTLKTTTNGVSLPVVLELTMKQKATDTYTEQLCVSGNCVYVDKLSAEPVLMTFDEAKEYCAAWGGRLPSGYNLMIALINDMRAKYPPYRDRGGYWSSELVGGGNANVYISDDGIMPHPWPTKDPAFTRCIKDKLE